MLVHNALTNVIIGICGILDSIGMLFTKTTDDNRGQAHPGNWLKSALYTC